MLQTGVVVSSAFAQATNVDGDNKAIVLAMEQQSWFLHKAVELKRHAVLVVATCASWMLDYASFLGRPTAQTVDALVVGCLSVVIFASTQISMCA